MKRKPLSLDLKDRKIIYELDLNARASFSEIAKKVRLHKDTVAYRVKQLEKNGVIRNYTAILAYNSINLRIFKIFFQFQGMTKNQEEELLEYFKIHNKTGWVAQCTGAWDLIIGFSVKDSREFNKIKTDILIRYSKFITNLAVAEVIDAFIYPRNYLVDRSEFEEISASGTGCSTPDDLDKKILVELSKDSRRSVIDIASKLKNSARVIQYRIKKLEKEGIIKLYKLNINLDVLGYQYYKCFITLHNLTKEKERELLTYCRHNKNIIHNVISLGSWDLEPEFEVQSSEEFFLLLKAMKNRFANIIKRVETVQIQCEIKFNYLP